jgi:hypothetical protein
MRTRLGRTKQMIVGATVALLSAGVGGAGYALASGGPAAAAPTPSTPPKTITPAHRIWTLLGRHAVDATVIIKTKRGYETLSVGRGTIGAFSGGQVTVDPPQGPALSATITPKTRFRNTSAQQLGVGQQIELIALDGHALLIAAPRPATVS